MVKIRFGKLPMIMSMELWLAITFAVSSLTSGVDTQMTWTPIFIGGANQVDFWTSSETGCVCNFNSSRQDCACCVVSGGCSCGTIMPKRCTQCGLEQHCSNMCNITLDSKELFNKSNRGFGQIKSPSVVGPTACTYKFIPDTGQRLELQVYRLLAIGRHNGKTCEGGWLQLNGGARICGSNARFDRPVVLFSDKSQVILHMQIYESTTRSQFLAYFSFASKASPLVGWPMKGGIAVNNSGELPLKIDCDWIYEDCMSTECVLVSPDYPGLYPPNVRCHYFIKSKMNASIIITFNSVLMPYNQCANDYIAVYADINKSSTFLNKLCSNETITIVHFGTELLVEFNSGAEMAPFNWNGFHARVSVAKITTIAPVTYSNRDLKNLHQETVSGTNSCYFQVDGDQSRSGHYDTRDRVKLSNCHLVLRGRLHDTVHLFLISYNLSQPTCKSKIEIWDGIWSTGESRDKFPKTLKRICSPNHRSAQKYHHSERYASSEYYSSSGRDMTAILQRNVDSGKLDDLEFMDISYYFHDEREGGTLRPTSGCDVEYYGLTSLKQGELVNPISNPFHVENYIKCKQHFIPAANQSIILTVKAQTNRSSEKFCKTLCGDSGCRCVSQLPLNNIDHVKLASESNHVIICLCGNHQSWLPLRLRSWGPMYIEWASGVSIPWNMKIHAAYKFIEDSYCGDHTITKLEGIVSAGDITNNGVSNQYYHQKCSWILDSIIDRQLTFTIESSQDRPCTAWNLTIHEYKKSGNPIGQRFYTFCSRDRNKNFTLPWKMNVAIVRLQALGRTAPQYIMKWQSITIATDIRKSGPSPAPNYVSKSSILVLPNQIQQIILLFAQWIIHLIFTIFIMSSLEPF
ncbi:hypothetical protein PV327_002903 [Microctonus hyperodae]|uniref:CUB domain-containing protein n=1 Tax=Microctonus hyperodae TaxID=165561 RepID=A0AA39FGL0_MICHY|nr:hypothetical protein PV327_002903 [Microctonus hyperodae]